MARVGAYWGRRGGCPHMKPTMSNLTGQPQLRIKKDWKEERRGGKEKINKTQKLKALKIKQYSCRFYFPPNGLLRYLFALKLNTRTT